MWKRLSIGGIMLAICVGLLGGPAGAATVRVGTLVLHADGSFEPRSLPRHSFAPVRFRGYGEVRTTNGSLPPPLRHIEVEFDHDGHLTTAGLPVCRRDKLEASTTAEAQRRCKGAIVGEGSVGASVPFAGFGLIELRVPLTLFNGPRLNGNPTVLLHARAPFPISETYVIVVPIEPRHGLYGYRSSFDVPPIAGGVGSLTYISADIKRLFRAGGRQRSYVSARCSDYILQARGFFSFADGTVIAGSAFKTCRPRP